MGGSVITIILPDDANTIASGTESLSLVKIYSSYHVNSVCFWVPKDTQMSFSSVTFKWWRFLLAKQPWLEYKK
jgi:hypothetical protein